MICCADLFAEVFAEIRAVILRKDKAMAAQFGLQQTKRTNIS